MSELDEVIDAVEGEEIYLRDIAEDLLASDDESRAAGIHMACAELRRALATLKGMRDRAVVGYLAGEIAIAGAPDEEWETRHYTREQLDGDPSFLLIPTTEAPHE